MIIEKRIQKVSLATRAIDALTLEPIRTNLEVKLQDIERSPIYKDDGFFVFTDIDPGKYDLMLSKPGYQNRDDIKVELPIAVDEKLVEFSLDGENELILVVRRVSNKKIEFDKIKNVKTIREGAKVLSQGLTTYLIDEIPNGIEISQAKLHDINGLTPGAIVRILRDKSLKMRPGPYYSYPEDVTLVVGQVTYAFGKGTPLSDVHVEIIRVNGTPVNFEDVEGVEIAFITDGEHKYALGTQADLLTISNIRGDYNFCFPDSHALTRLWAGSPPSGTELTLRASLAGYETQEKTLVIEPKERNSLSFGLSRL